jgi:hypothetical protein
VSFIYIEYGSVSDSTDPVWNEKSVIEYRGTEEKFSVRISVYDKDVNSNDYMGTLNYPLEGIRDGITEEWLKIYKTNHPGPEAKSCGEIKVRFTRSSVAGTL